MTVADLFESKVVGNLLKVNPEVATDEFLVALISNEKEIKNLIESAKSHAVEVLSEGGEIEGLRLARKKTQRKFTSTDEAIEYLRKKGYTDEQIFTTSLISPAQLEKIGVPKNVTAKITSSPEGALTVEPDVKA